MAVISTNSVYESENVQLPDWQKGEEILPGAFLAAKEIDDIPNLLSGHQLEIIPVRVHQCELSEGIVPFVEELTSNHNIIGIVGYFCPNLAQYLSPLAHYWIASVVQISAIKFLLEDSGNDNRLSYLQHSILPLRESIASATVQLLQSLQWNKIAIISNQNPKFVNSKGAFLKSAREHNIQIEAHLETFHSPNEYLQELQRYDVKIVVVFVSQSEAVDILCSAYLNGFQWPDYAWIFTDISKPDKLNGCYQDDAINNAIFLLTHTQINPTLVLLSGLSYSAYYEAYLEKLEKSSVELNVSLQSNPYANVLYDSIWAVALTINRSLSELNERNLSLTNIHQDTGIEIMDVLEEQLSQLSFQGATGWLNFSHSAAAVQTSVEILQIQNGQPVQIGLYDHSLNYLFLNRSALGVIPSDTLNRIYVKYPIALTVLLALLIVIGFALTTISMCLFVHYRKQPAVRATSSTLSLCMFIGCYFLLASSFFQDITSGTNIYGSKRFLRAFVCMFDFSITNVGIDLVFATVIAKTLRIYFIFKTFGKVSKLWSDQGLFLLISSIVSVKIVILIIWASFDVPHIVDLQQLTSKTVPPFIEVVQRCQSVYHGYWVFLTIGYSTLLTMIMVLLAILTRKIKRDDYKDSKKINLLVGALFLDVYTFAPLWFILRGLAAPLLSWLVYNIGTLIAAVLCQVLLLLPKTVPLVIRNYRGRLLTTWREITRSQTDR
jgi:gamma-aminobutyric acid type B receptor